MQLALRKLIDSYTLFLNSYTWYVIGYKDDKIEASNREVDIKVPLENSRSDIVRKRVDNSVSEIEANARGADSSDHTNLGSGILQNFGGDGSRLGSIFPPY